MKRKTTKRKSQNKKLRKTIFNKYFGKCAYCGTDIKIDNFQIDHIFPKFLSHRQPDLSPDRIDNLNPSCRKCNNFKAGEMLEVFRRELSLQLSRLERNPQFDRVLRFGQIKITETPIVFYFEKLEELSDWGDKVHVCPPASANQIRKTLGIKEK